MKYTHILMDLDGTVFDFDHAEKAAFFALCKEYNIDADEEMYLFYKKANAKRWRQYEEGILPKEDILKLRFVDFLDEFGIQNIEADIFSKRYIDLLVENTKVFDGAREVLSKIKDEYILDAVTNATVDAQERKLCVTDMKDMFHKLFISGQIGYPKPAKEFFEAVFDFYKDIPKENFLVVGDSLTADIKGACQSGIDSVWISFKRPLTGDVKPTFIIEKINDLYLLLKEAI